MVGKNCERGGAAIATTLYGHSIKKQNLLAQSVSKLTFDRVTEQCLKQGREGGVFILEGGRE